MQRQTAFRIACLFNGMRIELKMNTFRIKAYAKINLGLDVLRRRPDGYHEVKMIMQTVDLYDDLEFTKLAEDEIRILPIKKNFRRIRAI